MDITDVTPLARRSHDLVARGDLAQVRALLPPERPSPVDDALLAHLRAPEAAVG